MAIQLNNYLFRMLNEYDGFKYKSSLSEDELRKTSLKEDELRKIMAQYAVDCMHDTELAKEAFKILEGSQNAKV